jgi:hypothetical protein
LDLPLRVEVRVRCGVSNPLGRLLTGVARDSRDLNYYVTRVYYEMDLRAPEFLEEKILAFVVTITVDELLLE